MSSTFAQQKRNLLKTTFLREEPLFLRPAGAGAKGAQLNLPPAVDGEAGG